MIQSTESFCSGVDPASSPTGIAVVVPAIGAAVVAHPLVNRIIHLKTQHIGPDELLVGVKIDFRHDITMNQLAVAIDEVEAALRAAEPAAKTVYIEPDITRTDV